MLAIFNELTEFFLFSVNRALKCMVVCLLVKLGILWKKIYFASSRLDSSYKYSILVTCSFFKISTLYDVVQWIPAVKKKH